MDKPCYWLSVPQGDGTALKISLTDIPTVFAWIIRHNAIVTHIKENSYVESL